MNEYLVFLRHLCLKIEHGVHYIFHIPLFLTGHTSPVMLQSMSNGNIAVFHQIMSFFLYYQITFCNFFWSFLTY